MRFLLCSALATFALGTLHAQTAAKPAAPAAPATAKATAPDRPFTPGRTPDGQPDLQGMYTRNGVGGLEAHPPVNPIDPSGKNSLSVSTRSDGLGPYPKIFGEGSTALRGKGPRRRGGGIIDPPDKNLPWIPAEDAKRREFLLKMNPAVDLRHVELNARCPLPGLFEGEDNNNPYQFIQRAGEVLELYDYNHVTRVIHLDGRPHLSPKIRLFEGDSIGHWEGNTLVVDTTNFNDHTSYSREIPYLSDKLHVTEHFTISDANNIDYTATIDDPTYFTKPWTVGGFFARTPKDVQSLEFACAEGSQTLVNIFGPPPHL